MNILFLMEWGGTDMVDITMCQHEDCEKKLECYRYMAVNDYYQSYANFKNLCNSENGFYLFEKIGKDDKIRNIERELNGEKEANKGETEKES